LLQTPGLYLFNNGTALEGQPSGQGTPESALLKKIHKKKLTLQGKLFTQNLLAVILLKLPSTVGWDLLELSHLRETNLRERNGLWEVLCSRKEATLSPLVLVNVAYAI